MFLLSRIQLVTGGLAVFLRRYFTFQNNFPRASVSDGYAASKFAFARFHLSTDAIAVAPVAGRAWRADRFCYFD